MPWIWPWLLAQRIQPTSQDNCHELAYPQFYWYNIITLTISSSPRSAAYICVSESGSIVSDNGFSPIRRQAIIWTIVGLMSIEPLGTNFSEILIKIQNSSFTKMHLKISSAKRRPFCPGEDELTQGFMFFIACSRCHDYQLGVCYVQDLWDTCRQKHLSKQVSTWIKGVV